MNRFSSSSFGLDWISQMRPSDAPAFTQAPDKYILADGIRKLNPAFVNYQRSIGQSATTALDASGLMVVSSLEECEAHKKTQNLGTVALAPCVEATSEIVQCSDFCKAVGITSMAMMQELGKVFAKYEAPIGLMNKLTALTEFHELQFIVDDSGSMGSISDVKDQFGRRQTRFEEVQIRLKEMLEVLAYVPTPRIEVRFLNRTSTVVLERHGETPELFLENAYRQLAEAFKQAPWGSTPIKEQLQRSFAQGSGRRVARYLFCDGEPNGGEADKVKIADMVKNRPDPQGNPVTFFSCTDQDDQVEWMKEVEEVAPYCSEYDDFTSEAKEVRRDQGNVLPFTKGFYLMAELIGAMNPDDLDAMDESIPLTKWALENVLGIKLNDREYRHYFDGLKSAQWARKIENRSDEVKAKFNWEPYFHEFNVEHSSKDIKGANLFREQLKQANSPCGSMLKKVVRAAPFVGLSVIEGLAKACLNSIFDIDDDD